MSFVWGSLMWQSDAGCILTVICLYEISTLTNLCFAFLWKKISKVGKYNEFFLEMPHTCILQLCLVMRTHTLIPWHPQDWFQDNSSAMANALGWCLQCIGFIELVFLEQLDYLDRKWCNFSINWICLTKWCKMIPNESLPQWNRGLEEFVTIVNSLSLPV